MKSVLLGLPYTRRLMNPICKSDLLAAKALLLLSLLMPAYNMLLWRETLQIKARKIAISEFREGVWIKVKMM